MTMSFDFWCRWLLIASLFFTAFGVAAALAPHSGLFDVWIRQVDQVFFEGHIPPAAYELRGFLMGPLGGTIAGSYLMQAFVVAIPFRRREGWAWHAILWSMLLWFGVDSLVSGLHGAWFNVVLINLMPLVVFGIPLAATRSAFRAP
jgi:hypothetical protein